jgi:hypothetical protein
MKTPIIFAILMALTTSAFAQNASDQRPLRQGPISYEQRVSRGFGQLEEPRWAGDRPAWMRRGEQAQRGPMGPQFRAGQGGPRGPMMGQGRQLRDGQGAQRGHMMGQGRQFRGQATLQRGCPRVCPLCEKHKMMMQNRGGKFNQKFRR